MSIEAKLRVIDERAALEEKIDALDKFVYHNDAFKMLGIFQQTLLKQQLEMMKGYERILTARLDFW